MNRKTRLGKLEDRTSNTETAKNFIWETFIWEQLPNGLYHCERTGKTVDDDELSKLPGLQIVALKPHEP